MQLDSISVHLFTKNGWNMYIYYIITDIDECVKGSSRCDSQAVCINTIGSFKCDCKPGYSGDGFTRRGR